MKLSKNNLVLLLTILTTSTMHSIIGCQTPPPKKQRINFSNPSDAASLLDIKKAMQEVALLNLKKTTKKNNPETPSEFLNFLYDTGIKSPQTELDTRADEIVERILQKRSRQPEGILLKQLGKHANNSLYKATACRFVDGISLPVVTEIQSLEEPIRYIQSNHLSRNSSYFYGVDGHWYTIVTHL